MRTKTIQRLLKQKFDHFTASIQDEEIRAIVQNNTIITGGAIASMLLGEAVNDYDLYFRNKKSAFKIAEYFLEQKKDKRSAFVCGGGYSSNKATKHIKRLTKELSETKDDDYENIDKIKAELELIDKNISNEERVKIFVPVGGVIGDLPEDGEAYEFKNIDDETKEKKYDVAFISENAISLTGRIQLIIRFFGEPSDIHENYDFEHCKHYWTSWDNELVTHARGLECLLAKELFYTGSKYPLCSIFRTRKFIERGWKINAGQYLKMAMQLNELDLNDIEVLQDQLVGVDSLYFMSMLNHLRKKGVNNIDASYVISLVDKIF